MVAMNSVFNASVLVCVLYAFVCVVCVCARVFVYVRKDDTEVEETRMELMALEQTASPTSPTSLTLMFSATSIDKSDVISEVEAERITDGDSSVMFF